MPKETFFKNRIRSVGYALRGLLLLLLNTAVEKLADFVHPDHHKKIGFVKDVSAGAVMFVSLMAFVVGLLIYIPKVI